MSQFIFTSLDYIDNPRSTAAPERRFESATADA